MAQAQTKDRPVIDVRHAAQAAMGYFQNLFPRVTNFSLEEAELSDDENCWLITLGFDALKSKNGLDNFLPPKTKYKVFKVDAKTGKVLSMKIRSLG